MYGFLLLILILFVYITKLCYTKIVLIDKGPVVEEFHL